MTDPLDLAALRRAAEEAREAHGVMLVIDGWHWHHAQRRWSLAEGRLRNLATPEAILALVGRVEALTVALAEARAWGISFRGYDASRARRTAQWADQLVGPAIERALVSDGPAAPGGGAS